MNNQTQKLIEIGSYLKTQRMILGTFGNISIRNKSNFLITASGVNLAMLTPEDITLCYFDNTYSGKKPSKEIKLHQHIYEIRKAAQCVIHCSPFYATLLSCSSLSLKCDLFVESILYLQNVIRIPFALPGSESLAGFVKEVCSSTKVMILENHGVLICGDTIKEALTILEVLEVCCKMNWIGMDRLQEVSEEQCLILKESFHNKK